MFKTSFVFAAICGLLPAQTVSVQTGSAGGSGSNAPNVMVTTGLAMPGAGAGTIAVVARSFSFDSGKTVTGAPYSADEVTEHVQTLPDGNRIVNTTTTKIYRDSQGRTRTETTLATSAGGAAVPAIITIHDPVLGVTYMLDPDNKTAQKLANVKVSTASPTGTFHLARPDREFQFGAGPSVPKPDVKTEDLGSQTMDGLAVTGTRRTETIPAGAIGNEQPIQTTSERWFSPALQVVVKSVNSDPRMGQTTETLNNLSRAEPDASLFQVPSDYTIADIQAPDMSMFSIKDR